MKSLLFTIHTYIEEFLFGSRCAGCHTPGKAICNRCLLSVPLSEETEHNSIYGLYNYGHPLVSHSIWNLKYRHRGQETKLLATRAQELISEIIADALQSEKLEALTLVPIPQYKKKLQKRGFNQSETIAKWLSQSLPNSHVENILEKIKETRPQSHLSDRRARLRNIEGAMRSTKQLSRNKLYIVIDDVTTTGATFLEATRALSSAGARNVLCIALAHGYKKR